MCEPEINMHMPIPPHPTSPSPSSTPTPTPTPTQPFHHLNPTISPKLIQRMQASTCFRCGEIGHWVAYCPHSPSPSKKTLPRSHNNDSNLISQRIYCRCGHGFCFEETSNSVKNPGRKYYVCPIKRGKRCREFIQFCDQPIDESYMYPPPYKYPECECGAGVCTKVKDTDSDKYYFVCPIGQDHGSCGYKVWEDELLANKSIVSEDELLDNKSIVPIQESSQKRSNLGEGDDLLVQHSKRMRMMDNSEIPSLTAVSELTERDDAAPEAAPSRSTGFPEFEVADDLQEVVNSVPWDAVEREALLISRQSTTPSRISSPQNLIKNHSFANAVADVSFGHYCPVGWLGRLLFLHPAQGLKFPAPQPFFCCIFPSFDKIVIPKLVIIGDDPSECNWLAISNHNKHTQLSSSDFHTEVCRDDVGHNEDSKVVSVSPIMSQGSSQRKLMSMAERQSQAAVVLEQQLLIDLEDLDPYDQESMRAAALDTFSLLDKLSVDYQLFSEHVWEFINNASAVAEIDKSMENSLALEECNRRIEEERARFAQIQEECVKTEALLEASNEHRQRLGEEVSHLEAMLNEKQNQLKLSELESLKIETQLADLKRIMMEADTKLKNKAEEAGFAKILTEEREIKQIAAKAALENAKLELGN